MEIFAFCILKVENLCLFDFVTGSWRMTMYSKQSICRTKHVRMVAWKYQPLK